MKCKFYIGQKVVCIDDGPNEGPPPYAEFGKVYIIIGFEDFDGVITILLEGMDPEYTEDEYYVYSRGFDPNDFAPVTDISVFKHNIETLKLSDEELEEA